MAPSVARKGNQLPAPFRSEAPPSQGQQAVPVVAGPLPPEAVRMMHELARIQAKVLESSRWVGGKFADESRAMHYGEREAEPIHGQATIEEARELLDEGIAIAPLPFPVAPPGEAN